ncbi:MotA/TolQ/ExbB proton channel family protein [Aeromonas caviae]|uniref:MotA/TolQ/ExbB proton channel family protein n=1 Tax=Aeromonas caviae TaxID=648 RepID=UPI002B49F646|nr:MotA/TolQ/ExbB proton channel family protein [Aeromonas caviae]
MLSSFIENALLYLGSQALTDIFLVVMFIVLILSLRLKKTNRGHQFTQYTPTLLTTLGILGTFAGIVSGLLGFDVSNIDGSIGNLLSGLKTAFITSLVGMFLSIFYKLLLASGRFTSQHNGEIDEDEIGIAELYGVMNNQAEGIQKLQLAIGGDGDSSLVSQLKLIRSDIGDHHKATFNILESTVNGLTQLKELAQLQKDAFSQFQDRLWHNLQDFADMLSKSATEQVINALKEVISDFNDNLLEQFGDNFKQLNVAVLELVKWQENYRQQLEQMMVQYQLGVQAITQTEMAVSHISEESRVIPASMQELKVVMEVSQHQLQELQRHLEAFKDIRDRAVDAVPEIRMQIDETVNGMKAAAQTMNEGLKQATDTVTVGIQESASSLQKSIVHSGEELVANSERVNASLQSSSDVIAKNSEETRQMFEDGLRETNAILRVLVADLQEDSSKLTQSYKTASQSLVTETDAMRSRVEQGLDTMRKQFGEQLHQMVETQMQENARVLKGMSQHADRALQDTGEAVQKQVKMLDDALARELNQVLSELGRALATQRSPHF